MAIDGVEGHGWCVVRRQGDAVVLFCPFCESVVGLHVTACSDGLRVFPFGSLLPGGRGLVSAGELRALGEWVVARLF